MEILPPNTLPEWKCHYLKECVGRFLEAAVAVGAMVSSRPRQPSAIIT
jgi:hypothetical protein